MHLLLLLLLLLPLQPLIMYVNDNYKIAVYFYKQVIPDFFVFDIQDVAKGC